ncbi:MAG: response regulator [Bryobacteraceae bacterium]|nr:response regulator [Bryobacteraceae bacterium]
MGRVTLALAFCLACLSSSAQEIRFRRYLAEDGLANLAVQRLFQDIQGYLWIGTQNGLYRFDGGEFRHYAVFAGDYVEGIFQTSDRTIWAAGARWLGRVRGDALEPFALPPGARISGGQALAEVGGRLLVGTDLGVWQVDLTTGAGTWYWQGAAGGVLAEGNSVWFGCGRQICAAQDGRVRTYATPAGGPWLAFARDDGGRLWSRGTQSLAVLEPPSSDFRLFETPAFSVARTQLPLLKLDRRGRLLIPLRAGLGLCAGFDCRLIEKRQGIAPSVRDALMDREGSLWLGHSGQGVARALGFEEWSSYTAASGLESNTVWRIVRENSQTLWVGSEDGLFRGTRARSNLPWRFEALPQLAGIPVRGLAIDTERQLWIGSTTGEFFRLPLDGPRVAQPMTLPIGPGQKLRVNKIVVARDGAVWVLTGLGIFSRPRGGVFAAVPGPPRDLPAVYNLREEPNGERWIAGAAGLLHFDGQRWELLTTRDGLKQNFTAGLTLDSSGAIWVGYHGPAGVTRLTRFANGRREAKHFGTADGLVSPLSYSLETDAEGRIWNGTDAGISVYQDGRWSRTFRRADGLLWDDCNSEALLAEPDGSMWIGTSGGLAQYTPLPASPVWLEPRLEIAQLSLEGRTYSPADRPRVAMSRAALSLSLASLLYRHTDVEIRYRLRREDGWDPEPAWTVRPGGYVSQLNFLAGQPGEQVFEAQARLRQAPWPEAVTRFRFTVLRPWWMTYWAIAGALVALALLLYAGLRYRLAQEAAQRLALEKAVAERTHELVEAKARAEQASKLKSEFLAGMSHEIRTPLSGVLSLTDLVLATSLTGDQRESLDSVRLSGRSLMALLNDLLDLSKIEAGKLEVTVGHVPVRNCVQTALNIFRAQAIAKGLTLASDVDAAVPYLVQTDELRLCQILNNLLANALKFTEAGSILITVNRAEGTDRLHFAVRDTGIGIPADKQQTIFEAFRQVDSGTTRKYGGTGLGLSICRKLTVLLGGDLCVESAPGRGSTFHFSIHAPEAGGQPASLDPRESPVPVTLAPPAVPLRVLVVDDNKVNQLVARKLIEKLGHLPETAGDGLVALERIAQSSYDLVLMDVEMPQMDGLETTQRIRLREAAEDQGKRLPVVAMTARVMAGDREECLSAGMDDYLEKPIDVDRLGRILRSLSDGASRLSPVARP